MDHINASSTLEQLAMLQFTLRYEKYLVMVLLMPPIFAITSWISQLCEIQKSFEPFSNVMSTLQEISLSLGMLSFLRLMFALMKYNVVVDCKDFVQRENLLCILLSGDDKNAELFHYISETFELTENEELGKLKKDFCYYVNNMFMCMQHCSCYKNWLLNVLDCLTFKLYNFWMKFWTELLPCLSSKKHYYEGMLSATIYL